MKRIIVILLSVLMVFSVFAGCSLDAKEDVVDINWSEFELGNKLPVLEGVRGKVTYNSKTWLNLNIHNATKEQFKSYRDACVEKGYTIESEELEQHYTAFNNEGYLLKISYYTTNEMSIVLEAPEEFCDFDWPTNGLGVILPVTESKKGKITHDSSKIFSVHVGETTIDAYKAYVTACEDKGFVIDHSKSEDYYSAKNSDGYKIEVRYLGFNKIGISITAPKEDESVPNATEGGQENSKPSGENSTAGIGKEFKNAMDSYEEFMDEYVAFMKKYQANPADLSLLTDYANYMKKYTEFAEEFSKWEDEEMNAAELAYYIDVQARVSKKLLEVAG